MNPKQKRFAAEYLVDLNATQAAIRAGYSDRTAYSQGQRLLKHVEIQKIIGSKAGKLMEKTELTAERVLEEIQRMAFANMADYVTIGEDGQADVDLSKLTREQAAAIQEITVDASGGSGDGERRLVLRTRFKLSDKTKSLEMLAKYFKLLTEKHEHTGKDGGPIETSVIEVQFVTPDASSN